MTSFTTEKHMIELQGPGCRVRVIADSIANGITNRKRITTLELRYWRAIHAEFLTHRMLSRNASSSRAIPVAKMIEQVRNDPAGPIHWGKNQPGMQANEQHDAPVTLFQYANVGAPTDNLFDGFSQEFTIQEAWVEAAHNAAEVAEAMNAAGYHKQLVNRILEPFQYISVIVTATEWENFFQLRNHPDAQPEIQDLAATMKAAMEQSDPVLRGGDWSDAYAWHLPYVLDTERKLYRLDVLQALSTARNARVSYLTHDGDTPNPEKDMGLYERLVGAEPLHASPTEHIAAPLKNGTDTHKNFVGWHQFRGDVELRIERAKKQAEAEAVAKKGPLRRSSRLTEPFASL
jgi:hypothetical protein